MKTTLLIIATLFAFNAHAAKTPIKGKVDPRIKTVIYSDKDVYVVHSHYGYGTHIRFSPDEHIVHITIGDSIAWQVTPEANNLFLKPMEDNADTNLIVLTNKRVYNFELHAQEAENASDPTLTFQVSFVYPEEALAERLAKLKKMQRHKQQEVIPDNNNSAMNWNFDYVKKGSEDIAPIRVFNDEKFTYFQFAENIETPAIFQVAKDKSESLINFHVRGKYIVVERVAEQFILRHGNQATCIFNKGYQAIQVPSELENYEE